jgi:4-amino-4-deoxy-L-arabinose transferase-like glycosyltransferase
LGIGWQLGYYKHPPLYSWISAVWLSIFPRTNFFYHMLSMTSVAVATFGMWRISTRFFTPAQQVVLVATVFFLPPLTFLSINYNATSAMVPFWVFTLLFYIRVLERRRALDAFLVGLVGGLAMIAKYHSAVMLSAIFLHSILDREARSVYLTKLPWLALVGFIIPVAPHVWWLFDTGFITVRYAAEQGSGKWTDVFWSAVEFVPAILLYAAPGFIVLAAHRYPGDGRPLFALDQIRAWYATVEGRALLAAAALPPILTMLLGLVLDAQLSSLWSIPFFVFLAFPIVACLPAQLAERYRTVLPMLIGGFAIMHCCSRRPWNATRWRSGAPTAQYQSTRSRTAFK